MKSMFLGAPFKFLLVAFLVLLPQESRADCWCPANYMPADLGQGLKCYRFGILGKAGGYSSCSSRKVAPAQIKPDAAIVFAADLAATHDRKPNATPAGAARAAMLSANSRASNGVVICAIGANKSLENADDGADEFSRCQADFAAADELAKVAAKAGQEEAFQPDMNMLSSATAQATLQKFEKNFGVDQIDFITRLLASHGSPAELKELLSSKISEDKFDKIMAQADVPEVPRAKETSKIAADAGLKDLLRAKLDKAIRLRKPASLGFEGDPVAQPLAIYQDLRPEGLDEAIYGNQEEEIEDADLFDMIRMKYKVYTPRFYR